VNGDGVKEYTTFRNGQRVKATGAEAFKLAMGDGKVSKTHKAADSCAVEGQSDPSQSTGPGPVATDDRLTAPAATGKRKASHVNDDVCINNNGKSDSAKQAKISDSFALQRVRNDEK
jgi:hypothetical protein